jgi:hypothetical protein
MNSFSLTDRSKEIRSAAARIAEQQLEEPWFDEPPPSSQIRSTIPPVVHVGEFLGDPLADAWLR